MITQTELIQSDGLGGFTFRCMEEQDGSVSYFIMTNQNNGDDMIIRKEHYGIMKTGLKWMAERIKEGEAEKRKREGVKP
jgi:hypothetical protein